MFQLRNDLIELVDRRFLELSASLEENLSMLGSQVSQSIASHANVSSASSRGSLGGSDTSLVVVPDSAELVKRSEVNGEDLSLSHLNSSVPAWISNLPPCTSPERTGTPSEEGRSQLTSKSTLSESGSVVVVTPPESFVVMGYGDGESEDPSGELLISNILLDCTLANSGILLNFQYLFRLKNEQPFSLELLTVHCKVWLRMGSIFRLLGTPEF